MKENYGTLEEVMSLYDFVEDDLLENARIMGFDVNEDWEEMEETQLRKRLASEVLKNPRQVLSRLPIEDLMLLKTLKDAEPGMGMRSYPNMQMMSMALLGLAEQKEIEDGKMEIIGIPEDFKKAISPYVDEVLDDFAVKFRLYVEQILIGALNLYGVLTTSELKSILKDCMELEDDGSGVFYSVYSQSITLQLQSGYMNDSDDEDLFISPLVFDFGYIIKERDKRKETATLKPFSKEEIKEAGDMPVPTFPNPFNDRLLKVLESKLGFSEQEAYYWKYMLWRLQQEEDLQVTQIVQILMDAAGNHNRIKGIDGMNAVMQVVIGYLNHAHRWIFRGRCPDDLRRESPYSDTPPQIVLGPNMQRMGYQQERVQQMADDLWHYAKVGRNKPCPCGSGKKYKNCCGKDNI